MIGAILEGPFRWLGRALVKRRWQERDVDVLVRGLCVALVCAVALAFFFAPGLVFLLIPPLLFAAMFLASLLVKPTPPFRLIRVVQRSGLQEYTVTAVCVRAYLLAFGCDGRSAAERGAIVLREMARGVNLAMSSGMAVDLQSPLLNDEKFAGFVYGLGFRPVRSPAWKVGRIACCLGQCWR